MGREGLRVLEDTARFLWNDDKKARTLRRLRHGLDKTCRAVYPTLVAARQVVQDPGKGQREPARRNMGGVVAANCRRVEEALRVLEEYGRVAGVRGVKNFKAVRYQLYGLEKDMFQRVN